MLGNVHSAFVTFIGSCDTTHSFARAAIKQILPKNVTAKSLCLPTDPLSTHKSLQNVTPASLCSAINLYCEITDASENTFSCVAIILSQFFVSRTYVGELLKECKFY